MSFLMNLTFQNHFIPLYHRITNIFLQVIKDYQLFIVVGVLLTIDLAIMTTWQIADPFYRATKQMDPYVSHVTFFYNY